MVETGQHEAALKPLEEGLAKFPDNPWLMVRKALILLHLKQVEPAKQALRALLKKTPGHVIASILMTRLTLETEGLAAGITQFQQAISACVPEQRSQLAQLAAFLGAALSQAGLLPAAIKHLELSQQLGARDDESIRSMLSSIRANRGVSLWDKNPYQLWPPPQGVSVEFRDSFERALGWAREGLWSSAASALELLAAGSNAGAIADRNRGLCCLWIADHKAAVAALRRYIARTGPTVDTVDLEGLCQQLAPVPPEDQVESVRLSWPIRNRAGLLAALRSSAWFQEDSGRPFEPNQPDAAPAECFFLFDRPRITARTSLTAKDVPVVEGEVLVGQDQVVLETYDDGRMDRLIDRFMAGAGSNIPPAHPRTKVVGHESRYHLTMSWRWSIPEGLAEDDIARLHREQWEYLIREIWPKTPHPALRGRTPLQAAKAGDPQTALRAALLLMECAGNQLVDLVDWGQVRASLQLGPEPDVDPERVDLDQLHLSRWSRIPVEALSDQTLLSLYQRVHQWRMTPLMIRAARTIAERPSLIVKGRIEATQLYKELALDAARRGDRAEAESWIEQGRQSEPPLKQSANALHWQLVDIQTRIVLDDPEDWVPLIATLLDRYRGNPEATTAILIRLAELGLVQMGVDPKKPDQISLDTKVLEQLLSQFGPRLTTSQGAIWTPGSPRGGSAIWTPGSAPADTGQRPGSKIILPGS
jgi:hypothetical protein